MAANIKATPIKQAAFLKDFQCIGDKCEDTCCKGWGMQLDKGHKELYEKEAPELLDAVASGEAENIMRRDPKTDFCVKFDDGLCKIHKDYGTKFLGDACHFYPRIIRNLGEQSFMSATLSCPEVARLTLYGRENPFLYEAAEIQRMPYVTKNYKPEDMEDAIAESVVNSFIAMAGDEALSPERIMARIAVIIPSLILMEKSSWHEAVQFLIKMADSRLPEAEEDITNDYRLVNILVGLIRASKKTSRPRLMGVVEKMENALGIFINRESLQIEAKSEKLDNHEVMRKKWNERAAAEMAPVLRRWIAAQLSMASFPFTGFGENMEQRAMILGIRFATVKLALMSHMGENGSPPDAAMTVEIIQSLSRFLDHLADPTFSMLAYKEAKWDKMPRLRGLIGDK